MSNLEELDNKVDDLSVKVAVIDTRLKIGFAILALLATSPKIGGPPPDQALSTAFRLITGI